MLCACRSARTRFMNGFSAFSAVFADVSMNEHPNWRASACPSSFDTSRSQFLSPLLPTSMNIALPLFTRYTDCRKASNRSNVDRAVMEYTRIKPWPSLRRLYDERAIYKNIRDRSPNPLVSECCVFLWKIISVSQMRGNKI